MCLSWSSRFDSHLGTGLELVCRVNIACHLQVSTTSYYKYPATVCTVEQLQYSTVHDW